MKPELPEGIEEFLHHCAVPGARMHELFRLEDLRTRLEEANRTTNLTRIVSPQEYWCKHVADSLSIGLVFPQIFEQPLRLADVGTGAGFPLLPLAWANPALDAVGIESKPRKACFIEKAAESLGFRNCTVVARQVREVCDLPEYEASFDVVVARAVSSADRLVRECRRLLRPDSVSRIILYKTPRQLKKERAALERAARQSGMNAVYSCTFELPLEGGERQFVIITGDFR